MIRERLEQDLEHLCGVLRSLRQPFAYAADEDLRAWLVGADVDRAWVFDQAPVTVVPTTKVIGHVQVHRSADLWSIGELFVAPGPHQVPIARFLLRESTRHVTDRGGRPVLDAHTCLLPPEVLTPGGRRD